jgi:hypothetical protein
LPELWCHRRITLASKLTKGNWDQWVLCNVISTTNLVPSTFSFAMKKPSLTRGGTKIGQPRVTQ